MYSLEMKPRREAQGPIPFTPFWPNRPGRQAAAFCRAARHFGQLQSSADADPASIASAQTVSRNRFIVFPLVVRLPGRRLSTAPATVLTCLAGG
jgi:hypothetical protein